MDSSDKTNVWVAGIVVAAAALVIVCAIANDTLEKKWAFGKGLCQTQVVGSASWRWQSCK